MRNAEGTIWVTYNGEIYNFRELRAELQGRGHPFASGSDTEVLVHGYEAWGLEGLLNKLRGMFAFALWDERLGALVLARDRYGIKPLYYSAGKDRVVFASEVSAIEASSLVSPGSDPRAKIAFLLTGSIPLPWTTMSHVAGLPAGHYLICEREGEKLVRYYEREAAASWSADRAEASEPAAVAVRRILEEAVRLHLISDAPLGVFLSGGVDSSAVTALAAMQHSSAITTVSIAFDEPGYSEAAYQRMVASRYQTEHHEVVVREKDFWGELPRIFASTDQPSIDGINSYFVARAARAVGLKAVLSGLGGDELFRGYPTFRWVERLRKLQQLPGPLRAPLRFTRWLSGSRRRLSYLTKDDPLSLYLALRGLFTPSETAELLGCGENEVFEVLAQLSPPWRSESPAAFLQRMEFDWYLQNQLLKDTDVMSMAHSVEIRVPLLDHHLVETVDAVGAQETRQKGLLIAAIAGLLPQPIVDRPKQGFTFPFALWLRNGSARDRLGEGKIAYQLWNEFLTGRAHWSRVWAAAVANHWWGSPSECGTPLTGVSRAE